MKRAYFITGTDTSVGKTFVSCGIIQGLRAIGIDAIGMKPVETGCGKASMLPQDALRLSQASSRVAGINEINPYRFSAPLAPSIASRIENKTISFKRIRDSLSSLLKRHDIAIIEGSGGLMTPVAGKRTNLDLCMYLDCQLVIVADNRLGCINHTLLTIYAARTGGARVKGIILNNSSASGRDLSRGLNLPEIKRLCKAPVIGCVPFTKKNAPLDTARGVFSDIARLLSLSAL
jgi:dethiobiotin synthetase